MMKNEIQKTTKKKSGKMKSRILSVALITTLLVGGTAAQSNALDLGKTIGDVGKTIGNLRKSADSLIYKFKSDPTISSILGVLNQVTTLFGSEIQRFTNISNADLNKVRGVLGVLAPNQTEAAIDKQNKDNPVAQGMPITTSQSIAAVASSTTAANTVLSKEGQTADKETLEQISKIVEDAGSVSTDSSDNADAAQQASSSQDVLKILASQASNQAAINVAQLRLAALQNNNLQAIKTQLAVANQANASIESRLQSEHQQRILEYEARMAASAKRIKAAYDARS